MIPVSLTLRGLTTHYQQESNMARKEKRVFDTVDAEAIKLLKTDPDAFFKKTRVQPFGFAVSEDPKAPESDD